MTHGPVLASSERIAAISEELVKFNRNATVYEVYQAAVAIDDKLRPPMKKVSKPASMGPSSITKQSDALPQCSPMTRALERIASETTQWDWDAKDGPNALVKILLQMRAEARAAINGDVGGAPK